MWNIGSISGDDVLRHTYVIANHADRPLEVARVDSPCGCITAKPAKSMLAPGETTEIPVEFTPVPEPGPFRRSLYVIGGGKSLPLSIVGEVKRNARLVVSPAQLNFGAVKQGGTARRSVTLYRHDSSDVALEEVRSSQGSVNVVRQTPVKGAPHAVDVELEWSAAAIPSGNHDFSIELLSPRAPTGFSRMRIWASVAVEDDYDWVASILETIRPGETREVLLISNPTTPLPQGTKCAYEGDERVSVSLANDGSTRLSVQRRSAHGNSQNNLAVGTLVISTDAKEVKRIPIVVEMVDGTQR